MHATHHATRDTTLIRRLRQADRVTPDLMRDILAQSARLPNLNHAGRAPARLEALVTAEAWTDAALAWAAIEAPQWRLRRLAQDGDVWHCALSRRPDLPIELDDTADGTHPVLPLAIVMAAVDARARQPLTDSQALREAPRFAAEHVLCCDNFG